VQVQFLMSLMHFVMSLHSLMQTLAGLVPREPHSAELPLFVLQPLISISLMISGSRFCTSSVMILPLRMLT
jgi:hypothetical protein